MKAIFLSVILLFGASFVAADAYGSFSSAVDFNVTIKDLASHPDSISGAKLYLVDGTISSIRILDSKPDEFLAEINFLSAEWKGTDQIITYSVILHFPSRFAASFPAPNKAAQPGQFALNSRGLALVQFVKTENDESGNAIPVFDVKDYRLIR